MKRVVLTEHQSCPYDIEGKLLERLRAADEAQSKEARSSMFDWSRRRLTATNMVGVMQVPGLNVEVLPKVDANRSATTKDDNGAVTAQDNLLYMLWQARHLPITRRGLAEVFLQKMPLLEALIAAFADALLTELGKGVIHQYRYREDNLRHLRGRLKFDLDIKRNLGLKDRFFVGFDEFETDIPLNRLLRLAARLLMRQTSVRMTRHRLNEALLLLADVEDVTPAEALETPIELDRHSQRYDLVMRFARSVVAGRSPSPSAGRSESFSYSVPMEQLFEAFVAQFIVEHRRVLGLTEHSVRIQSAGVSKSLLVDEAGRGRFNLRPDVLIGTPRQSPTLILDTKWKHLAKDGLASGPRVPQSDLYQLYAYATRFDCADNVLLYPSAGPLGAAQYWVPDVEHPYRLRTAYVDVSQDFYASEKNLVEQIYGAVHGSTHSEVLHRDGTVG